MRIGVLEDFKVIKFLLCLSLFVSASFADENFKKGYEAGLNTCSSQTLHVCSVEFTRGMFKVTEHGEGFSRGLALKSLMDNCQDSSLSKTECSEAVRSGRATCNEI